MFLCSYNCHLWFWKIYRFDFLFNLIDSWIWAISDTVHKWMWLHSFTVFNYNIIIMCLTVVYSSVWLSFSQSYFQLKKSEQSKNFHKVNVILVLHNKTVSQTEFQHPLLSIKESPIKFVDLPFIYLLQGDEKPLTKKLFR